VISSLLNIEICVHVIDNGNNEIRSSGIERDAGGDEKQLIKFAWPYYQIYHKGRYTRKAKPIQGVITITITFLSNCNFNH